jgi:hypothetical protein
LLHMLQRYSLAERLRFEAAAIIPYILVNTYVLIIN